MTRQHHGRRDTMMRSVEQRSLSWGNEQISTYRLCRSARRRTLALIVRGAELVVHAPLTLPMASIEQFMAEKRTWIAGKLALSAKMPVPSWQEGNQCQYLGRILTLQFFDGGEVAVAGDRLLMPRLESSLLKKRVSVWYRQQAMAVFLTRLEGFVSGLSRLPKALKLSSARQRWGSCTADGVVRINWRLVQASVAEIDYVLAHELAHLRHMNHSPRFWQEVGRLYPDYASPRQRLKDMGGHYRQIDERS